MAATCDPDVSIARATVESSTWYERYEREGTTVVPTQACDANGSERDVPCVQFAVAVVVRCDGTWSTWMQGRQLKILRGGA